MKEPKATLDILRSLKMGTVPPDFEEPATRTIEYDWEQVDGIAEEAFPMRNIRTKRLLC
ncbi:MAG: hypothetical protein KC505_11300 [Myxococcales bacterium]|nr:hypothetical protein [Myxococcales bacterium]USN51169.1 MAG: hypothetical protein H6731_01805 [Myxococcales bacterium]